MKNTKQTTKSRRTLAFFICLALMITLLPQLAVPTKAADEWTISRATVSGGSKFTITRPDTSYAQTVKYRTVSISALEGKHFTGKDGSLTFAVGEASKTVTVNESSLGDVPLRYRYYSAGSIYYALEVTDQAGTILARNTREYWIGTSNATYHLGGADWVNSVVKDLTYFSYKSIASLTTNYYDVGFTPTEGVQTSGDYEGYILIDDSYDYSRYPATVSSAGLFVPNRAGGSGEYYKLIGDKLLASVYFTEKEKNDGYAYVQILTGDASQPYDEGYDPNETVNDPVKSIYKACFELQKGSGVYSGSGKWIFPHSDDFPYGSSQEYADFYLHYQAGTSNPYSYLWKQKFRSEELRANYSVPSPDDSSQISVINNAFMLDPTVSDLTVRFDCGGKDNDTFGYKDLKVRWALLDATAPTVLKDDITVSRGIHAHGNTFTVSIPFSEPVVLPEAATYYLDTSWGKLYVDTNCSGTNVLSYSGTIDAAAGTPLTIDSVNSKAIKDLVGNRFAGDVSKTFSNLTVDETYTIKYGGYTGVNPTKYTAKSDAITIVNPTRSYYIFTGWTGTDLSGNTMTVTIPAGSTGDRSYTPQWQTASVPEWGTDDGADGSAEHPYIITTPAGLVLLSDRSNTNDESFNGVHFKLGCDIDMSSVSNFTPIGKGRTFYGYFDGDGYAIRNLTEEIYGGRLGLFAYINGTKNSITNLILENVNITDTDDYAYHDPEVATLSPVCYVPVRNCFVLNATLSGKTSENSEYSPVIGGSQSYLDNCYWHNVSLNGTISSNVFTVTTAAEATAAGTPTVSYAGVDYYSEGATITVTLPAAANWYADGVTSVTSGGVAVDFTKTDDTTYTFDMPAGDVTVTVARDYFLPVPVDGSALQVSPANAFLKMVRNTPAGLTVAGMKALLQNDPASLTFKKRDNTTGDMTTLADDDLIGTGTVVEINSLFGAGLRNTYSFVITGDVSGDGLVNGDDYDQLKDLILANEVCTLETGYYHKLSVDFNQDAYLDVLDLREMKRLLSA